MIVGTTISRPPTKEHVGSTDSPVGEKRNCMPRRRPRYCASLVQSLVQDSGADSEQQSESWMYRRSVTDRKADPVVVVALRHRSLTMLEVESDQI